MYMTGKSFSVRWWLTTALGVLLDTPFVSVLSMLPVRWWITTALAALLGSQIALGLVLRWPFWIVWLLLLALGVLLWVIERHNERETDVAQIWWVPTRVLWATRPRAVLSAILVLVLFVTAGLAVFGDQPQWAIWVALPAMLAHRLVLGRRWLKRDLEAQKAVEGSEE